SHGDCQSTEFCDLGSDPKLCLNKKPYDTVCSVAYCSNFCRSSVTYTINNQKKCGCTADTQTTDCGSGKNCGTLTNNLNRCVAIIQFNGSCTDLTTTQCASNLSCVNSKCKKNDGQTCSAAADCVSNYCNSSKVCAQSVGACNGDLVKSWQGGLNGHICATTSQGCCKSGLCPDGKCGCYSHMDCASASYCQLSTGLCIAGCTDQLPDGNGVTTSVCPTNYYCADGNICRIRCDHTSPAYQCGNTGQFCDRGPGVCINKLLYGDAIPTGVTATEACISNKAQAGTSVCGCDPNVAGYCSANVSGTSYCDTADNKCKTGCTNNSQCTVSSTPYCDVKGIMGKPKQCVAASLLQQKCDANVPCAPIAGMSCASYSGSPSYCKMSRDYNCNSDGDCVNSCIGTGNCSDGGDQCCAKLSSNKTCRDWCLR
ncbi:MAG: hypothetical protein WCQ53_07715, partial [bacterium]